MIRKASAHRARIIFSRNLRAARLNAGFSQEEMAARAGLHRNYVGSVERGERNISIDNMEKLANSLSVQLIDLLREHKE